MEVPIPVFLSPSGKGRFFLTLSLWLLTPLLFSVPPEEQSGSQRLLTVFVPELIYGWAWGDRCGPWNTPFVPELVYGRARGDRCGPWNTPFVPELVYSWARGDRCGPCNTAFLYRPQRTWASWRAGGACL